MLSINTASRSQVAADLELARMVRQVMDAIFEPSSPIGPMPPAPSRPSLRDLARVAEQTASPAVCDAYCAWLQTLGRLDRALAALDKLQESGCPVGRADQAAYESQVHRRMAAVRHARHELRARAASLADLIAAELEHADLTGAAAAR